MPLASIKRCRHLLKLTQVSGPTIHEGNYVDIAVFWKNTEEHGVSCISMQSLFKVFHELLQLTLSYIPRQHQVRTSSWFERSPLSLVATNSPKWTRFSDCQGFKDVSKVCWTLIKRPDEPLGYCVNALTTPAYSVAR